jgi:predicted PurR-regulated permease PerM
LNPSFITILFLVVVTLALLALIFSNHLSSYAQKLTRADELQGVDEQQEDTGQEIQEELEEFDISTDNIIEEGHDINQGKNDIPFELPFP